MDKNYNIFQIATRRLKNVVIFIQTILSFVLSRKIINIYNDIARKYGKLDLSWTKDSVLIKQNNNITGVNFVITSTKVYVRFVTLSINDDMKQGFKK